MPVFKHLYANAILLICPVLFQRALKLEVDLEHSYLEGEIVGDGGDEDYSLEHQVITPFMNLIYSSSYRHWRVVMELWDLLHSTLVGSLLTSILVMFPFVTDSFSCAVCSFILKM
jgi:hypothetical protein